MLLYTLLFYSIEIVFYKLISDSYCWFDKYERIPVECDSIINNLFLFLPYTNLPGRVIQWRLLCTCVMYRQSNCEIGLLFYACSYKLKFDAYIANLVTIVYEGVRELIHA